MSEFIPKDYKSPVSNSGYMKLQQGENLIRILSTAIMGWVDWKDNKPHRFKMNNKPKTSFDPKKPVRHFWAFIVWDYADKAIKIMEITQSTIQGELQNLSQDEDWGNPSQYDVKITRKGESLETEYSVIAKPKKDLTEEIKTAYDEKKINLSALFSGNDPFKVADKSVGEEDEDKIPAF